MSSGTTVLPKWIQRLHVDDEKPHSYMYVTAARKYASYISFTHWGWSEYSKQISGPLPDRSKMHVLDSKNGDNIGDGYLSVMSGKKLKKAINFLLYVSKFKLLSPAEKQLSFMFTVNFITLTLPAAQQHSDQFIKQNCLEQFIAYMKMHHGLYAYVWKAETQDNGNIHFHIVTNVFIDHTIIRQVWNRIIEKHGYIEAYMNNQKAKFANGFIFNKSLTWINKKTGIREVVPEREQIRRMKLSLRSGHRNPNSTDVHSIKKVSNLGGYLASYMTKKDKLKKSAPQHLKEEFAIAEKDDTIMQLLKELHPEIFKRPITGQLWNSSKNLKVSSMSMRITDDLRASLLQMQSDIAQVVYTDQYVTVTRFISGCVEQITSDLASLWSEFLSNLFPELIPPVNSG